uniref:THH1/TOM1/TOM3 domain-containing protein n=1 Tax=Paramoeba aestuarina TaxID=180227 RepID=A0A7S4JIG5_9EUKA|mmetsp:Transcript_1074/g.1716  ORF Transcript_1074/g.1716 Transcript_1074/m.1716 type:complete len:262 (+) Transcript_1074:141-926(+)
MDHQDSEDKQGIAPVTLCDITLYSLLTIVVSVCTFRQFCCRRFKWRKFTTQQIFHVYLFAFMCCRETRSIFSVSDKGGTPIWFFFSRNALYLFTLSFGVVIIYFAIEVMFVSRLVVQRSWWSLYVLTVLCEMFVVAGSIYYAIEPERFSSGSVFYDMSIDISTFLCLCAAVGILIVGLRIANRFKKGKLQRYHRAYYKMMGVTLLTTGMMIGRFAMFLYRPITGEYLNEWLFNMFAYWLPEISLTFSFSPFSAPPSPFLQQ